MKFAHALLGLMILSTLLCGPGSAVAQDTADYDAARAQAWGANDNGMRSYVLVLLKTGPKPLPAGPARDEMFKGHFANMQRLAKEGVLVYAGPLDGVEGLRGLFILAVPDVETAQRHVATDPVIAQGEMVAEAHRHFGSAALMGVNEAHVRIAKRPL